MHWYNQDRRHSAIRFVTPQERREGLEGCLLQRRVDVFMAANQQRWSGPTKNWQPVRVVHLNSDQSSAKKIRQKEMRPELKQAA
ncbi:MAG: hypothetical protein H7203_10375 [Rhizobacter sp.]|nr:hypothetical protein [Burkholderiales bacterium]